LHDDDGNEIAFNRGQAGGLRIVKDDEIARTDEPQEFLHIRLKHLFVDGAFSLAKRTPVALRSVEGVVEPFGDPEELGCAVMTSQRPSSLRLVRHQLTQALEGTVDGHPHVDLRHVEHAADLGVAELALELEGQQLLLPL